MDFRVVFGWIVAEAHLEQCVKRTGWNRKTAMSVITYCPVTDKNSIGRPNDEG